MGTSVYFNNTPADGKPSYESLMIEDLIIESIQIYGTDVYYLPRSSFSSVDDIYGEDPVKLYDKAYKLEMYIANAGGPEGPNEFFSKFGMEIKEYGRLIVARKTFNKWVPGVNRPREGDLVWVPHLNNIYEIKFVKDDVDWHTFGRKAPYYMFFELHTELYTFSNESIRTGVDEIDEVGRQYSYTITLNMSAGGTGLYTLGELVYQGNSFATATATGIVKGWTPTNTTMKLINVKGAFSPGANVTGNSSGAIFSVSSNVNRQDFSNVDEEIADNIDISSEANNIFTFTETNPFGNP